MATFYIRKTGSDSNAGTSASAAWLTIGKALGAGSSVASGDTVWIGAGTYREVVTVGISPSSTSASFIGDVDGSHTGDMGSILWTTYTTSDTAAPSASPLITVNAKNYVSFQNIVMESGNTTVVSSTTGCSTNIRIADCLLTQMAGTAPVVNISTNSTGPWDFIRCTFIRFACTDGQIALITGVTNTGSVYEYNSRITFENCFMQNTGTSYAIKVASDATYRLGGVTVNRCTILNQSSACAIQFGTDQAYFFPSVILNSIVVASTDSCIANTDSIIQVIEENNRLHTASATPVRVASSGSLTVTSTSLYPFRFEFHQSEYQARERVPWFSPSATSKLTNFGRVEYATSASLTNTTMTGTSADGGGGGTAWTTASNAAIYDGTNVATVVLGAAGTSNYMNVTNFGFAVPTDATILGVRFTFRRRSTSGAGAQGTTNLIYSSASIGSNKGDAAAWPVTTYTPTCYGSQGDLWGAALTPAIVNASTFGLQMRVTSGAGTTADVDGVSCTVFYRPVTNTTVDLANRPRPYTVSSTYGSIGALERHDTGVVDTAIWEILPSMKLVGPGDQIFFVPVDAESQTFTMRCQLDGTANHTDLPQIQILANNEIGVAAQTITATSTTGWQTLASSSFTPTAAGVIIVLFVNRANSATGTVYFDTIV